MSSLNSLGGSFQSFAAAYLNRLSLTPVTFMSVFYANQLLYKEFNEPRINTASRLITLSLTPVTFMSLFYSNKLLYKKADHITFH